MSSIQDLFLSFISFLFLLLLLSFPFFHFLFSQNPTPTQVISSSSRVFYSHVVFFMHYLPFFSFFLSFFFFNVKLVHVAFSFLSEPNSFFRTDLCLVVTLNYLIFFAFTYCSSFLPFFVFMQNCISLRTQLILQDLCPSLWTILSSSARELSAHALLFLYIFSSYYLSFFLSVFEVI